MCRAVPTSRLVLAGLPTSALEDLLEEWGQPRYRGRQIADWIYRRNASAFEQMTDLPFLLRRQLAEMAEIGHPEVTAEVKADDGTTKYRLRLADGQSIECVWLPYRQWSSVCLSTQVGCALGCAFCATGQGGFVRNLAVGEIIAQFLLVRARAPRPVTHAVFMGMGEPLLNYDAVLSAVRLLHCECGISARRLTLSTVGIVPGIRRLSQEGLPLNLAISLHGPDDETRTALMPMARRYPLCELMSAVRDYIAITRRKVTFEYLLLAGVNDSIAHADRLAHLLREGSEEQSAPSDRERSPLAAIGVNLIPYNETGTGFRRPSEAAIRRFQARLRSHGIAVTRRLERGGSIAAACGQLHTR